MEISKGAYAGVAMSSLFASNDDVASFRDTTKMFSITPARKSSLIQSKRLSSEGTPPLPLKGGFRLQPRKNVSNLTNHSHSPSSSSRGRKRGAQTMVSAVVSPYVGVPKGAFKASTFTAINSSDDEENNGMKALPRRNNKSSTAFSPIFVDHAMQSMSIRSPTPSIPSLQGNSMRDREPSSPFIVFSPSLKPCPIRSPNPSTPSSQGNIMRDREAGSPFIVFSPSLKPCPYRQRPRSESFSSLNSSTKPPSSVVTAPRTAPMYGSPRRKANGINNYSNNNECLSTPRSHCQTANTSQAPGTPASIRTLPSPHTTPLPRSMRLTPRSRRHRDELSSETSMFLSPNEKLNYGSPVNRGTSILSFEGGLESLEAARPSSYVPSPFSYSRMSVASLTSQGVAPFVGESGGSLRVETRSLLGVQDSTSTLDYIISANARAAALDCDGSLSDESDGPFVLANPTTLAQERDVMTMPPPRPSRRRRMSPAPRSISIDALTYINNKSTIQTEIDSVRDISHDVNPTSGTMTQNEMNVLISSHGDKKLDLKSDLSHAQSSNKLKSPSSRYDRDYFGRLQHIESCCSLVGLGLAESSSSMDSNAEPATPPKNLNTIIDSTFPRTPTNDSVRISCSDADNVHLTIASMAVFHQQPSPTMTACYS